MGVFPDAPDDAASYGSMMLDTALKKFLMETYVPLLDEAAADQTATSLSLATAELREHGADVELLHSFAVLAEETCFSLFSAATLADVRTAAQLAQIDYEHLAEVICYRHG